MNALDIKMALLRNSAVPVQETLQLPNSMWGFPDSHYPVLPYDRKKILNGISAVWGKLCDLLEIAEWDREYYFESTRLKFALSHNLEVEPTLELKVFLDLLKAQLKRYITAINTDAA